MSFQADLEAIRQRARERMMDGPVTPAYGADRTEVIAVLNDVVATEIVCVLRYKRHAFTAKGLSAPTLEAEFIEHANQEEEHMDMAASGSCSSVANRTSTPADSPRGVTRSTRRARAWPTW